MNKLKQFGLFLFGGNAGVWKEWNGDYFYYVYHYDSIFKKMYDDSIFKKMYDYLRKA